MSDTIYEKVDNYIANLLAEESEVLLNATREIEKSKFPNQSISANQGKFLQVLAYSCSAKRILELGTMAAYSTIWLANALPENGKVITIEFDKQHAELAKRNIQFAKLEDKIELQEGNAIDILNSFVEQKVEPFDLVFIDADKPPYLEYFKMAIKLSRSGSIIVCDNVIRNGKVLDENSNDEKVLGVQRLNNFLKNCTEVNATIIQTVGVKEHDGMVIAVVK